MSVMAQAWAAEPSEDQRGCCVICKPSIRCMFILVHVLLSYACTALHPIESAHKPSGKFCTRSQ